MNRNKKSPIQTKPIPHALPSTIYYPPSTVQDPSTINLFHILSCARNHLSGTSFELARR